MKILCIGAVVLTWPLIPFGAYVRLKNAGLSCPDWPLCYGQLFPPSGFEIWLEVGHRFVAVLLGIVIIAITFFTFFDKKYFKFRKLTLIILILVCFQGILGGLTVIMVLWPPIVTLHLLVGNFLFGLLVYLTRIVFDNPNEYSQNISIFSEINYKNSSVVVLSKLKWMMVVTFIIILSGGYNSSTYSGTSCAAFPGCHEGSYLSFGMSGADLSNFSGIKGHILPPIPKEFQGRFFPEYKKEWINMMHRLIAIIGGLILIIIAWFSLKKKYGYNLIGSGIVFLVLIEICIGIFNVVFRVQPSISSLHTAVAATLIGLLFFGFAEIIILRRRNENFIIKQDSN